MSPVLRDPALRYLRSALDDPRAEFRDGQWEAIESLIERNARLLVVQRTGWGKSLIYFLATRLLRDRGSGPALLISPLLALMRNQIVAAKRLGIRAITMNSSNRDEWSVARSELRANRVDILLVSPERLANDEFRERVLLPIVDRIGLFVVDEAHCISDWGHDFRPDYRRITRVIQSLPPNIPVIATTATANDRVVEDVVAQLGTRLQVIRGALARSSLRLQVINLPSPSARMAWLVEHVPNLPGSGIIYALTVRDVQMVAYWLQERGIDAHPYWGGLDTTSRENLEQRLLENDIKALVATTALGMGFDKPDLGFVIHYQRPGSAVHYYQQIGRAGRALQQANAILLAGVEDQEIVDYFIDTAFPPESYAEEILAVLNLAEEGLRLGEIEQQVNLSRGRIESVLKQLAVESPAPVSKLARRWVANPVYYRRDDAKIEQLTQLRRYEQERMLAYCQGRECLMAFLQRELNDPSSGPCGRCAVCLGQLLVPERYSTTIANEAAKFISSNDHPIEPRKQWPLDALAGQGWTGTIAPELRMASGRALCAWGDDGWGRLVRDGKATGGRFNDALVRAAAQLVRERWRPRPYPTWVTCVPSLTNPKLVPDFARRLAGALKLRFVPCITKTRQTAQQKTMLNSYHQARNLAGVFSVSPWRGIDGPVLLVDDMVDSGWTFTVVTATLRQAGSGPVYPLALAVTTAG
jgi:ATP-dependent DNA helicase RecQ